MGRIATLALALSGLALAADPLPYESRLFATGDGQELTVSLTLSCDGVSWDSPWDTSAVVTVKIDGAWHHDVVVHSPRVEHSFPTGPLSEGPHQMRVELSREKSPAEQAQVVVEDSSAEDVGRREWLRRSPILFGRPQSSGSKPLNARSDVPMLMYVTESRREDGMEYEYSVVWSNEDGGTGVFAPILMARYGRTTDIEWVYRVRIGDDGEVLREVFQAAGHGTRVFTGLRVGDHPALQVSTDNNNLRQVDPGKEPANGLRFAMTPVLWEDEGPRERVMDAHPWTYRIAWQEMTREKGPFGAKAESTGDAKTAALGDVRDYLMVDVDLVSPAGAKWRLGARVDGEWYWSDHGLALGAYEGSGWGRTAIELPPGTSSEAIEAVMARVSGIQKGSRATLRELSAFRLDAEFWPGKPIVEVAPEAKLGGDSLEYEWVR
ncbi:MAG: hypothetical protein AAB434_03375 [Planctomycetota bacterium]